MTEASLRASYPDLFFFIDRDECALSYNPAMREFHLDVRPPEKDVGQLLSFCPFSGKALPSSLRDAFFDALEEIGLTGGLADLHRVPQEFRSEDWWIKRNL